MKKFAYGAIALAAVGAAGHATDTGWSGLDQEINSLSASLAAQNATGPKLGGYIITSLDYESDPAQRATAGFDANGDGDFTDPADTAPTLAGEGDDTLGWSFRAVRLQVSGDLGHDYSYKVSFDLESGTAELKDAYVDWKITDGIKGRWGQYKMPMTRSGLISRQKLLFLERTVIGDELDDRQLGIAVSGQFEQVNFWINAQNGLDDVTKDMFYNARVTFDIMGDGVAQIEGAYGAGDALGLTVGGAIGEDSSLDNGLVWVIEAALTSGPFSIAAEIADFDTDIGGDLADSTPWDATVSFLFTEMYEIAFRYEDLDNDFDEVHYSAGINRYVAGHDIKWTLQYVRVDTDEEDSGIGFDSDQVSLGLTVGF